MFFVNFEKVFTFVNIILYQIMPIALIKQTMSTK